jgi:hypothetical protein
MSSDYDLWCPQGKKRHPGSEFFCPEHPGVELVPPPVAAAPAAAEAAKAAEVCWSCGTRATEARNDTCTTCHQSLVPPALVIKFSTGTVVLPVRRTSAELGRAGEHSHVFDRYPNVSGRHALVSVDEDGNAWLTPFPEAPNGTFVNGREIHERTRVQHGDQIRFATDQGPHVGPISESITQPDLGR